MSALPLVHQPSFKWFCCRYLLRILCIDTSYSDKKAQVFFKCRDGCYKPDRPGMLCDKRACLNCRKEHGIPKTVHRFYS